MQETYWKSWRKAGRLTMERITRSLQTRAFDFVRKADYKSLLTIVQNEHPQTIALILSYARADQAAEVLAELSKDLRIDVVERISNLDRANPDTIKIVEEVLAKKFEAVAVDLVEIGGINYMADIMNQVDRGTEKQVFDELYARDPKLADEIRKRMFVFEDIVYLDNLSIQTFLRAIDTRTSPLHLRLQILKWLRSYSKICHPECRRPSKQILNIYIMYACVMSKRPSNA